MSKEEIKIGDEVLHNTERYIVVAKSNGSYYCLRADGKFVGEKRCEEISRLLGRDVIFSREYTHILSNGMMFKSSMYDVVLKFKDR